MPFASSWYTTLVHNLWDHCSVAPIIRAECQRFFCFLFVVRTPSDLETQPPNEWFTITNHNKRQWCRFTRRIHIQSNVMIHIKYINVFPDLSVLGFLLRSPSDQDNLTPSLSLLTPIPSTLDHLGIIPNTHPVSHIRSFGPQSPSDASP